MDNMYNSASFFKKAFNHKKKVMVSGVTKKRMQGIPNCVKQEVKKNKEVQRLVKGTMKVAVLEGNKDFPNLVVCSVYDSKPVHFLSMLCSTLRWELNNKAVFNVETGLTETL